MEYIVGECVRTEPAERDRRQALHEERAEADPDHDDAGCWCCCWDCSDMGWGTTETPTTDEQGEQ